jgi:hypothetical protein
MPIERIIRLSCITGWLAAAALIITGLSAYFVHLDSLSLVLWGIYSSPSLCHLLLTFDPCTKTKATHRVSKADRALPYTLLTSFLFQRVPPFRHWLTFSFIQP